METPHSPELDGRIEQNVRSAHQLRTTAQASFGAHTHLLAKLTRRLGRPLTLYTLLVLSAAWMTLNLLLKHAGREPWDAPPFFWLEGLVGLLALVTAVLVLIGQNRQAEISERRADLDLQVNLLTAQRTAKLIALVEELRRDLPNVRNRKDPEADELAQAENPEEVARAVHASMEELDNRPLPDEAAMAATPEEKP